jgi:hypothetical protein
MRRILKGFAGIVRAFPRAAIIAASLLALTGARHALQASIRSTSATLAANTTSSCSSSSSSSSWWSSSSGGGSSGGGGGGGWGSSSSSSSFELMMSEPGARANGRRRHKS